MKEQNNHSILAEGKRVLQVEADALIAASQRLDDSFLKASELMHQSLSLGGKIVVRFGLSRARVGGSVMVWVPVAVCFCTCAGVVRSWSDPLW